MPKILITGGAGFIGSHVVIDGVNRGYDIINLDALTYASDLENLKSVEEAQNYRFIKGNICDKNFLEKLFVSEKFDAVIHLAAESHVDMSIKNPEIFVQTNVMGTQYSLDLSLKNNISKFIHVSTDEVYGELTPQEESFTEDANIKPNSPYSASKAGSDFLVRAYNQTFGLNTCITRCSNNYGPHQDRTKLLPKAIINALQDQKIPVYGKGENIRDWLFVKDHAEAIWKVFEQGEKGEVYNIGGNNEQRNIDIVKKILGILGKPEDLITFAPDRLGHDFRYAINAKKIHQKLGWEPRQDFDQMLIETIDFYKQKIS
jgi:dTDP-glucose 4,6-dehydratase